MRTSIRTLVLAAGLCLPAAALAQPATQGDLGTLDAGVPVVFNTGGTAIGEVKWWTFTLDRDVKYSELRFLDILTSGFIVEDTEIAVYDASGNRMAFDDDDGPSFESFLTFGTGSGAYNGGSVANGRDWDLPAGTYYLGVTQWQGSYAATGWSAIGGTAAGDAVDVTLDFNDTTPSAPGAFTDLGAVTGTSTVTNTVTGFAGGQIQWYKFSTTGAADPFTAIDMDTEGSLLGPDNDTLISLWGVNGALQTSKAGATLYDDDDGSGFLSQLTFGQTNPVRPAVGGAAYNGRDGTLRPGVYYVGVKGYDATFPSVFGLGGAAFALASASAETGDMTFTIRSFDNVPSNPTVTAVATPVFGGIGTNVTVVATVVPGGNPTSTGITVQLNANGIDGGVINLLDDGVAPDAVLGDGKYSGTVTVGAGATNGANILTVNVADAQSRTATVNVNFSVIGPAPACPSGNETFSFTGLNSDGAYGAPENGVATFTAVGGYDVGNIAVTGRFIPNNIFGYDATIDILFPGAQNVTFFPIANGTTVGVPEDVAVDLDIPCAGIAAAGNYEVRTSEDINDTGIDGVWANLCVALTAQGPLDPTAWVVDLCGADVGELIGSESVPVGSGPLNSIQGFLGGAEADLYRINICDVNAFSASTIGSGTDTRLMIFNLDGTGVVYNDDEPTGNTLESFLDNSGSWITTPGEYILGVSLYPYSPNGASGVIWNATPFDVIRTPDGPGAAEPLASWTGAPFGTGGYNVILTGVCFPGGGGGGCNLADITEVGGTEEAPGNPDGQLTVDDLILFVNLFSAGTGCPGTAPCNRADVTGIGGGGAAPDGELTVDDLIEFVNAFSTGC